MGLAGPAVGDGDRRLPGIDGDRIEVDVPWDQFSVPDGVDLIAMPIDDMKRALIVVVGGNRMQKGAVLDSRKRGGSQENGGIQIETGFLGGGEGHFPILDRVVLCIEDGEDIVHGIPADVGHFADSARPGTGCAEGGNMNRDLPIRDEHRQAPDFGLPGDESSRPGFELRTEMRLKTSGGSRVGTRWSGGGSGLERLSSSLEGFRDQCSITRGIDRHIGGIVDVAFSLSGDDGMHAPPGDQFSIGVEDLDSMVESIGDIDRALAMFDARWFGEESRETAPVSPCSLRFSVLIDDDDTMISGIGDEDVPGLVDVDTFGRIEFEIRDLIRAPPKGSVPIEDDDSVVPGVRDRKSGIGYRDIHGCSETSSTEFVSINGMNQLTLGVEEPDEMIAAVGNHDHTDFVCIDAMRLMQDARLDPWTADIVVGIHDRDSVPVSLGQDRPAIRQESRSARGLELRDGLVPGGRMSLVSLGIADLCGQREYEAVDDDHGGTV